MDDGLACSGEKGLQRGIQLMLKNRDHTAKATREGQNLCQASMRPSFCPF